MPTNYRINNWQHKVFVSQFAILDVCNSEQLAIDLERQFIFTEKKNIYESSVIKNYLTFSLMSGKWYGLPCI